MIPCPICSNVIHEGALSRGVPATPFWQYARHTSGKLGKDHFVFTGCNHACALVTNRAPVAHDERQMTEARWDIEARRLLAEKTVRWTPEQREKFSRLLGYVNETAPA